MMKAFAQYLQTKQISMSPGWVLIGVIASIYATKVPLAIQERKLKEREDELAKREQQLAENMKIFQSMSNNDADRSDEHNTGARA